MLWFYLTIWVGGSPTPPYYHYIYPEGQFATLAECQEEGEFREALYKSLIYPYTNPDPGIFYQCESGEEM